MEIIDYGILKEFRSNNEFRCNFCGCRFKVEDDKIRVNADSTLYTRKFMMYTRCPMCNEKVEKIFSWKIMDMK